MSNTNSKFPSGMTTLSSEHSSATSGLESIALVALQALQRDHGKKVDEEEPNFNLPTKTKSTSTLPPLKDQVSRRVVSADFIFEADRVNKFETSQNLPQAREEETSLPPGKALSTVPCSRPVESAATSALAPTSLSTSPSSSSSPAPTKIPTDEDPNPEDSDPEDESYAARVQFNRILCDPKAWLHETEDKFAKLPPVDQSLDNDIVVRTNDVLCGRGGETNHHPGNIRYRSLVKAYQKLYLLAKRRDKPKIAQCIVVSVRGVNGRFLRRTKNSNGSGPTWVDVGNVKAREKTSQALREGAPNLRENANPPVTTSGGANDSMTTTARKTIVPDDSESRISPPALSRSNTASNPDKMRTFLMSMCGYPTFSSSVTDIEKLTAQVFTKNAAQLMKHPAFHQLDQAQKNEAIQFEMKNARATAESVKKLTTTLSGNTTSAIIHEQGRTSPMAPSALIKQEQQPCHPTFNHNLEYPYHYVESYSGYWQDPSGMDRKPDQIGSLRDLNVANAAAPTAKKRPSPSASLSDQSNDSGAIPTSLTVVSDTGSDVSSLSSLSNNINNTDSLLSLLSSSKSSAGKDKTPIKHQKTEAVTSASRGGSRLKRLKLRMKNDFD